MTDASFRLDGKSAFVTGAGRGLGRAGALALARAGAHVVLVSRTRSQLEETAALVEKLGRKALVATAETRSGAESEAAVRSALAGLVLFGHTMFGMSLAWVAQWWPIALVAAGAWLIYQDRQSRRARAGGAGETGDLGAS